MVQRLERQTRRDRSIADYRDDTAALAALRRRHGHAQRRADRRARVTDAESVVHTFRARRKRCKPSILLDGVELFLPSGEHLVRVGLVSYVPNQPVVWRI